MVRPFRHFGGEIVDLPMAGNGHVQRIEFAADHHHAILAHLSIGGAGVEELDDGQFPAGQRRHRTGQRGLVFYPQKMAPRVKTGRSQQQRVAEAVARHCGRGVRGGEQFSGESDGGRRHHARQARKPRMIGASRGQHRRGLIDHRRRGESHDGLRGNQRGRGQVGIADGIEHHLMRRERHFGIEEFGQHHEDLKDAVVQQISSRYVAAPRGNQQQQRHRRRRSTIRQL